MQRYTVQGYAISISNQGLTIRTPADLSLRINGYNPETGVEEALMITVVDENLARVETSRHLVEINYIEDPDDPNGQITFSQKVPGSDVPNWVASQNSVPKQVIKVLIQILNDDEAADAYLVQPNGNYINSNINVMNDPEGNGNNTNSDDPSVSGGSSRARQRRRLRHKTKKARKARAAT